MAPETKKEKAPKKVNLLDDSDSDNEDGGADITAPTLKVNEEFAKRFEHNKKREEMHRLEEKFKKPGNSKQANDDSDGDSSSSDETEDEDGFLATEDLDAQISATLNAIKNKDPRVLDSNFSFFQEGSEATPAKAKKEKPMFLKDYHREKILAGGVGASDDEDDDAPPPQTYNQEQDALKKSIISEINKAADGGADDEDFVKRKPGQKAAKIEDGPAVDGVHPARAKQVNKKTKKQITEDDIKNADRDPELFLSNFMAARAWTEGSNEHNWKAFDSDEGEGDEGELYDKFEQAYNLRFEDPDKSNAALKTYSREIVSARSVRKEAATSRRKQRDAEKEKKEAEKAERKEEKSRLRKLKLEEAEEKLKKIKHAAGLRGEELKDDEWLRFLNDAWDDDRWESEMKRRFGEDYYAEVEGVAAASDDEEDAAEDGKNKKKKKSKPKKPTWDDDIDINDIIPDFKDDTENPQITLSDDETAGAAVEDSNDSDSDDSDARPSKKRKTQKDLKKDRLAAKKASKLQRAKLEALVDAKMDIDLDLPGSSSLASLSKSATEAAAANETPAFRYRETSPQAFGMTARDILLAPSDAALNSFAGLKKLATFRDQEKKRKDKKRLGKKARLRQWRREHFGEEFERTGPTFGLEDVEVKEKKRRKRGAKRAAQEKRGGGGEGEEEEEDVEDGGAALDGGKKRKRSRGKKKADEGVVAAEE